MWFVAGMIRQVKGIEGRRTYATMAVGED